MRIIGGILLVVIGVAIYIWGINCDDYNKWFPGLNGAEGFMSDGYGSMVLMAIAVITCIWTFLFTKFIGFEFNAYVYIIFVVSFLLIKFIGLASIPLMLETTWYVATGLELILPESFFENSISVKIMSSLLIVLWLVAALKINNN